MHISKSTIKRVDEGLPANAIRGSNAYKKLDKDASPNKGTFEPSHQSQSFYKEWRYVSSHPEDQILGERNDGIRINSFIQKWNC